MPQKMIWRDVDGRIFDSLAALAKFHGISPQVARNRLEVWHYPFSAVMPKSRGSTPRPIIYEGTYYPSLTACAIAEGISISGAHQYANKADLDRQRRADEAEARKHTEK